MLTGHATWGCNFADFCRDMAGMGSEEPMKDSSMEGLHFKCWTV